MCTTDTDHGPARIRGLAGDCPNGPLAHEGPALPRLLSAVPQAGQV